MSAKAAWQRAAEHALNGQIQQLQAVAGGDFATAYRASLRNVDGAAVSLFIKTHSDPPAGFFSTEAAGLEYLAQPAAVRVPQVLAVADDPPFLAMQWIPSTPYGRPDEAAFGRQLAQMHAAGLPDFGRPDSRTTGSLALPNPPLACWYTFYAQCRLQPLATIAAARAALPNRCIARLQKVAATLPQFADPPATVARLHGDLWAGNRLVDEQGDSWLIDPAMHGGHPEFDLAMMRLFGGFAEACFDAYNEVSPLQPGWRERVALHQLAPLVVHAIKFGGSYRAAVKKALAQYA